MAITFARLQEYLDTIVEKNAGDIPNSPHGRFWRSHEALTQQPLPKPKCQGAPIFAVKYLDAANMTVDADGSPLYIILTQVIGFCGRQQMPSGGPFISDPDYSITLPDGTTVPGAQIMSDIHEWLANGAKND